jgi:hypothetical protein
MKMEMKTNGPAEGGMKQNCLSLPDFFIQVGFLYRTFGSVAANKCDATILNIVLVLVSLCILNTVD